tara:strand:- start:479 stop:1330 length:852 start_codon:yes stop_codon:yes gene_type:complete
MHSPTLPAHASALLASLATLPAPPAHAVTAAEAARPAITSRARLDIKIGDARPRPLTVGLYGEAAPSSVSLFESLVAGNLDGGGLTYSGSSVSRIERDRLIIAGSLAGGSTRAVEREIDRTGFVRSETVSRAEKFTNRDSNTLSHDRAGLLSMRRGGGAFEFALTPAANSALDATRLVIGETLGDDDGENLRLIAELNELSVRQPSAVSELGGVAALYGLRLGLGFGFAGLVGQGLSLSRRQALACTALGTAAAQLIGSDPRDQPDLSYRPLTKVRIVSASLL